MFSCAARSKFWTTPICNLCPLHIHPLQVDTVLGDDKPNIEQLRNLKFTTRVVNESMRLYPQPPVLIRRWVDK